MRIGIKTLGCKANRYESDKIIDDLQGFHEVFEISDSDFGDNLDFLIVNTCTVTHIADRKSRQAIRSLKKRSDDCRVLVFGCGVNVNGSRYQDMKEVDYVFIERKEIIDFLKDFGVDGGFIAGGFAGRTRALIKIQDGCERFCTYCIIPRARGPQVSYPREEILSEVLKKEAQGFKEIVLTGIIISEWRENGMDLADLCEFLIKNSGVERFRLSSLEPKDFSDKFVGLFESGRLCPHLHMSLQSGSDNVLERMRRQYNTSEFLEVCDNYRRFIPDIGLTTDVIVGFPGETDQEFEETCDFVRKIGFLKIHVFPYSKRENTPAYYMRDQVDNQVKQERTAVLRDISEKSGTDFISRLSGNEYEVLVESCENGLCQGFTPNYIPVQFNCSKDEDLTNQIVKMRL